MKKTQNNPFSHKYIHDIKALFPIIRRTEKIYLRQMKQNIDDYCTCYPVSSMEEIYLEFGKPEDVVHDYYSLMDMAPLFTSIRIRHTIKNFLTFICVILFAITLFVCAILYKEHLVFMRQEAIFVETIIS